MEHLYSFSRRELAGNKRFPSLLILFLALLSSNFSYAQDYMINRGVFAASYSGGLRMCVVDKNEYYQPYNASSHCAVRQYKNGIVSQYGTTANMPPMAGNYDIAYDSASKVMYVGFFSSDYDSIYTFKKGPTDPDWVLLAGLLKPASNLLGYTVRLSFNKNGGSLFMAFNEQTSNKIYLYELVSGTWTNRTGATAMACYNSWFDLVSYGNKVILTSTPLVVSKYTLRVHVWDIISSSITTLPDWNNGSNFIMVHFATTAYNVYANEYVSFLSSNYTPKALKSAAGGAWSDISTGLTGAVDNGSWGCYVVFNNLMSRYTAFFSGGTLKGYSWDGTIWTSLTMPVMSSTNTFATSNYKDAYFLAWSSSTQVGIFTPNETPFRNTMNIASTPGTTTCDLLFPDRGVGNKVVVFVKQGTYVAPFTVNNTTYTASTVFGSGSQLGSSGWFCVYNGVGQALTITGLTQGTTYQVQALEYNGLAGAEMYMGTAAVTGNPTSFATTGPSCSNPTSGGTIAADQSICGGLTPSPFTSTASPSGETGIIEYKWQMSTTGSTSGFTDIASSNSATYAPGALTVNTWYKRIARVTCKADWTGAAESNVLAISILPLPGAAGTITGTAQVCQGGSGYIYSVPPITNANSYSWTVPTGASVTAGAGTNTITVSYSSSAASGNILVYGVGTCGNGTSSQLPVTTNAAPVPVITGPATACAGSTGKIYTTQTGMTNYVWTISAGGVITAGAGTSSVTITWNTAGAQTVSVNYNNAAGCPGASPTAYPVTVSAVPVPTIAGSATICQGLTTTYSTQTGMTGYVWTVSAGGQIMGGQSTASLSVKWNGSGAQNVSVNYSNAAGCPAAAPVSYPVIVNAAPVPTITGATSLCATSGYYAYTTEPGMTGYAWTVSSGASIFTGQGTNTIQVYWGTGGAQTVSVNYSNSGGCSAASSALLNVNVAIPPGPAGSVSGPSTVCAGQQGVSYSIAPIPGATAYAWNLPAGAVVVGSAYNNTITVNFEANSASGSITASSNNICGNGAASPPLNVTVNSLPAGAGTVSGSANVCAGAQSVAYSVGAITNATGYSWTLPSGANIASGANTNAITVNFGTASGPITVTGTNSCGSGTASPNYSVTVNPVPGEAVVTASGYLLTSSAASGNQWYHDGTAVSGATGQTYTVPPTEPGWYWTVVTLQGCSSDSSNNVYIQGVGISETVSGNISIYPVPNNGSFKVSLNDPSSETFSISIYNELGLIVYHKNDMRVNSATEQMIDIRPAPSGVYTVVFSSAVNKSIRKIIVKD